MTSIARCRPLYGGANQGRHSLAAHHRQRSCSLGSLGLSASAVTSLKLLLPTQALLVYCSSEQGKCGGHEIRGQTRPQARMSTVVRTPAGEDRKGAGRPPDMAGDRPLRVASEQSSSLRPLLPQRIGWQRSRGFGAVITTVGSCPCQGPMSEATNGDPTKRSTAAVSMSK